MNNENRSRWGNARKLMSAAILLYVPLFTVTTMEWPAPDGKLTGNFGMNNDAYPVMGDNFVSSGEVLSTGAGEVLFHTEAQEGGNFIAPLGNWIAIDHGDSYISVYAHLDEITSVDKKLEIGDIVGRAGRSGWASREGFYFAFFDRWERRWINPVRVLNALADTSLPIIHSVKLQNAQGQLFDLAYTRTLKQGRYAIFVHATDRPEYAEAPLAPFRIVSSLNGTEIARLELETFSARDGVLLIYRNGLVPVQKIYAVPPAIEAVSETMFTRGQASLDITVQDFARNSRSASYRLFIE